MCTKDWLKEVLSGEKDLLKMSELRTIKVKKYDELSVKHLYEELLQLEGMADYFPSRYPEGRVCDRDYLFNVANTKHPDVVKALLQHALQVRHAVEAEDQQQETITLSDHWAQELKSLPLVSHVSCLSLTNMPYRRKARWLPCSSARARLPA